MPEATATNAAMPPNQPTLGFAPAPCSPNRYGIYCDTVNKAPVPLPPELRVSVVLYTALDSADGLWRAGVSVDAEGPAPRLRGPAWSRGYSALPSSRDEAHADEAGALAEARLRAALQLRKLVSDNEGNQASAEDICRVRRAAELVEAAAR